MTTDDPPDWALDDYEAVRIRRPSRRAAARIPVRHCSTGDAQLVDPAAHLAALAEFGDVAYHGSRVEPPRPARRSAASRSTSPPEDTLTGSGTCPPDRTRTERLPASGSG